MRGKTTAQTLADSIKSYIAARRDKKEEDFLKSKPEKKNGVVSKGINSRLIAIATRLSTDKSVLLMIGKLRKTQEQTQLEFQQYKYKALLNLIGEESTDIEFLEVKKEYTNYLSENNFQHEPVYWLNQWANKAKDISFASHVAKLTHSSSKGSNVLDTSTEKDDKFLTTNSLPSLVIDTASSNAASLPIADILKISSDGISVLDCLKNDDMQLFEYFTDDISQISAWISSLKQAYDSDEKQSYFLSKQVYFPIGNEEYHLLLPLTSSSLAQEIYLEHKRYFDDEQKMARKQREHGKYSPIKVQIYPQKARFAVTRTKGANVTVHLNVSNLNKERNGMLTLLSCMPSQWQRKPISYFYSDTIFNKILVYQLAGEIRDLAKYLTLLKNKNLSVSEPKRATAVLKKLREINAALFDHVLLVNANEGKKNWTQESALSIEQQLFFEPWRDDESATAEKISGDWQAKLSQQFGRWLNRRLLSTDKKLNLTPIQAALWAKIFAEDLREFIAIQEVAI